MRLLLEILIILGASIFIYTQVANNNDVSGENEKLKEENKTLRANIYTMNIFLEEKEIENDSIKEEAEKQAEKNEVLQKEKEVVETNYRDSLKQVKDKTLAELTGDTSKVVKKDDTSYVLVEETDYRSLREDRVKMKKLKTLCGIYQREIQNKNELLKLKNMRIENYKNQVSVFRNKSAKQQKIIQNQKQQLKNLEDEVSRQKWHKRVLMGGGAAIILLTIF